MVLGLAAAYGLANYKDQLDHLEGMSEAAKQEDQVKTANWNKFETKAF